MTLVDMPAYEIAFSGEILQRGFWLYVWRVDYCEKRYFYVGRTGDSSSANASSPFNRIGQHLDLRENAKGNSLARRLNELGVEPGLSRFRMIALGPFFEEKADFELHKPKRDFLATLEFEVAGWLSSKGYDVIGTHDRGCKVSFEIIDKITLKLSDFCGREN